MRGKPNRSGLASLRTRAYSFSSISFIKVTCRVSFEEKPYLLNDICKALDQYTIFPCFCGLKIEIQKVK